MLLDLSKPFKQLSGEINPAETLGKFLANVLAAVHMNSLSMMKIVDWSLSLVSGEPISIDCADLNLLKDFVNREKNPGIKSFPPFAIGQIEKALYEVTE